MDRVKSTLSLRKKDKEKKEKKEKKDKKDKKDTKSDNNKGALFGQDLEQVCEAQGQEIPFIVADTVDWLEQNGKRFDCSSFIPKKRKNMKKTHISSFLSS
jgi:hypothetical protein